MTVKSVKSNLLVIPREVPLYQDPFHPVLVNSPSLHITPEQDFFVKEVLLLACSDSAFAKKAYLALKFILTQEEELPPANPVITSLTPATAVQGEVVTVVVTGTGFTAESYVWSDGQQQPTTLISPTELSFIPDTNVVHALDVYVQNYPLDSNSLMFDVTAPVVVAPTITSIDPVTGVVGGLPVDIHIVGTGFTAASVAKFGGVNQVTTFTDESNLLFTVPSDVAVAGVIPVVVDNSNSVDFTWTAAARTAKEQEAYQKEVKEFEAKNKKEDKK